MQLIGRGDSQGRVADLPPPLVADDGDVEGTWRRLETLNAKDVSSRRQEQDDHNQDGHDRPGQLDLVAAIDLWGLTVSIRRTTPEADEAVGQQPSHDDEDDSTNAQDKIG